MKYVSFILQCSAIRWAISKVAMNDIHVNGLKGYH